MKVWDNYWALTDNFIFSLGLKMHHKTVFNIYKFLFDSLNLKDPDVIELGSGCGELTARLIKRYGGSATLVDRSTKGLKKANKIFKKHNIDATFLKKDLFNFKPKKKFDIVHSEGLIEHFLDEKQKKIIEAHKKCVKKDGFVLISVPRPAWYYRITKWFLEKINKWPFGFEKAMDKHELKKVLEDSGLKVLKLLEHNRYSFALAKI